MFRSLTTLMALAVSLTVLPQQASANLFGSQQVVCYYAVQRHSVYPAHGHGARRLPGQWWNQSQQYAWSPPANHAYGVIDHGSKPWSQIPGDGYVGAPDKKVEPKASRSSAADIDSVDIDKLLGDDDFDTEPDSDTDPKSDDGSESDLDMDMEDEKPDLNALGAGAGLPPEDVEESDALISPRPILRSGRVDLQLSVPDPPQSNLGVPVLFLAMIGLGLGGHSARRMFIRDVTVQD